eukprot:2673471-Rhodomonas_salina.1
MGVDLQGLSQASTQTLDACIGTWCSDGSPGDVPVTDVNFGSEVKIDTRIGEGPAASAPAVSTP